MKKNTKRQMKRMLSLFLAVMLVCALCACGGGGDGGNGGDAQTQSQGGGQTADAGDSQGSGTASKELNIAWIGPVTGSASRSGEELYNGAAMQFEKVNYQIGDYKLNIHKVDSESNAEKAALAYEECILSNNIDVGLNTWHSWVSASCIEVAAKYEIPQLLTFGASDDVIEKVKDDYDYYKYWAGKTWPQPIHLVAGYVDAIDAAIEAGSFNPENKILGVYGVDEDWGRTFAKAGKEGFEENGWTCAVEEYFALGTTDYYAVLNKMKDAGCTLLCGTMSDVNAATAFIKQSGEVGLNALVICDGLGWLSEWYDLTGEASDYVLDMIPQYATASGQEFVKEYTAKYGYEPGPSTAGLAYDTAGFFLKILQATLDEYGELTSETIMKCWEEKVKTGQLTYTMADDDAIMMPAWDYSDPEMYPDPVVDSEHYCFPVVQYFGGVGVPVFPESMAEQEMKVRGN